MLFDWIVHLNQVEIVVDLVDYRLFQFVKPFVLPLKKNNFERYFNETVHTFSVLINGFVWERRRRSAVWLLFSVSSCISLDIFDDGKSKRTSNESKWCLDFLEFDFDSEDDGWFSSDGDWSSWVNAAISENVSEDASGANGRSDTSFDSRISTDGMGERIICGSPGLIETSNQRNMI